MSSSSVPGTVLGIGNTLVSKIDVVAAFAELVISWQGRRDLTNKWTNK